MPDVLIRYGVVHLVHGYVVIQRYYCRFPLGQFKRSGRKRKEKRFLLLKRICTAAVLLLERLVIERIQPLSYCFVQLIQGHELSITKRSNNVSGDDSDRTFHHSFILG